MNSEPFCEIYPRRCINIAYRKAIPIAIRRLVLQRGKCEYPDCHKDGVEIHHIVPYALSEDNSEANLLLLCKQHHFVCQAFPRFSPQPDTDILCDVCARNGVSVYAKWSYSLFSQRAIFHCRPCHTRWMQLIYKYKKYHQKVK